MAQRARSTEPDAAQACTVCAMTLEKLAVALGVGVRTLRREQAAGNITPIEAAAGRRPARYDVATVARALLQAPGDAQKARAARDQAQADLLRLRVARERGAVFPKDAVIRAGRGVVEAARSRLLRLPADLRRAGTVTADGEPIAESAVREALEELSRLEHVAV